MNLQSDVQDTADPKDDHETNSMLVVNTLLTEYEQVAQDNVDEHPVIEDKSENIPPNENKVNIETG